MKNVDKPNILKHKENGTFNEFVEEMEDKINYDYCFESMTNNELSDLYEEHKQIEKDLFASNPEEVNC